MYLYSPVSVSAGTPKLFELSLINASAELVNVCGDNVRSCPLDESKRSKVAVTASVAPEKKHTLSQSSNITEKEHTFRLAETRL